jgi:hypothetical protein
MRAGLVWTVIQHCGSLTGALDRYEEFTNDVQNALLCAKPIESETYYAAHGIYRDLQYIYDRQGATGQPISFQFVELCLTEETAPRGLSAVKDNS